MSLNRTWRGRSGRSKLAMATRRIRGSAGRADSAVARSTTADHIGLKKRSRSLGPLVNRRRYVPGKPIISNCQRERKRGEVEQQKELQREPLLQHSSSSSSLAYMHAKPTSKKQQERTKVDGQACAGLQDGCQAVRRVAHTQRMFVEEGAQQHIHLMMRIARAECQE